MTALTVCQRAAPTLGIEVPDAVMAATDPDAVTLAGILVECGERVLDAHDWQAVKALHTITGDGSTEAYDLPADFRRIPKGGQLWRSRDQAPLLYIDDHDRWLGITVRSPGLVTGAYTILGGQALIKPALASGETVKLYYQSAHVWTHDGAHVAEPLADADAFRLSDRLLRLALIWQWRASKGLPYAEDMANFEHALAQTVERDRGPRSIEIGGRGRMRGVATAHPTLSVFRGGVWDDDGEFA